MYSSSLTRPATRLDLDAVLGRVSILDNLLDKEEVIITYKGIPALIVCHLPLRNKQGIPATPPRSIDRYGAWAWDCRSVIQIWAFI